MLSRAMAESDQTLIINLPGSPKRFARTLAVILPVLQHALETAGRRTVEHGAG
jgi:molybdopterin biosynthesis enzyme MoaB